MSFTSLENLILNGFGWMNYKRSEKGLSIIAKKILKYQFKREALEIHNGANTKEILTYAKWEDRCEKLLKTFFTRDSKSIGIILFPDTEITLQNQVCQVETWQRVMSTLTAWCKSSSSKDATGLIVRNYNLKDHFDFCGITEYDIKDVLAFKDSKKLFSFQESNKRFLAFNPTLKIIFIVRLVELIECDMQLLKKEVDYCIDEVNLLCFLLKDVLEDTGIIVTGLAVYSGENAHMLSACKDCDSFVVPFEIFETVESFQSFWELFAKRILESLRRDVEDSDIARKDKPNSFQAVASKVIGYLAHLQFGMLENPILPIKKNNPTSNIEQGELLLDRYQMEIAYSDHKRLWLEGNYGTGKTVVALKKLELLLRNLQDKEVIYFVSFSGKSELDFAIKQKFKRNKNVRTIKGGFSLSNIVKTQILPKERELGTKSINLIVDEYSPGDLSTEEARSLGQILKEEESFKNSTVLIAAQPIEIIRCDNFYDFNVLKRTFSEEREGLGELIKIMGMKVKTLKNVMRTTVQINILVEITQKYLDEQSNHYVRKEQHYEGSFNPLKIKERFQIMFSQLAEKLSSMLISSSSKFSSNSSTSTPKFQFKEVDHNFILIDYNSLYENASSKPLSVASDDSLNPATSSRPSQSQKIIDFDELLRLMPTENIVDKRNYQETVTKYRYTCDSQIGHNISGSLPQLIKLEESTDVYEQIALIASVLDEIIKPTERRKTVVIHFEHSDPPFWLKSLFQHSSSLTLTTDVKKFSTDTSGNLVLVKNMNFVKGLEFSNVLLALDSNEHHLRQFIPEAITRCSNNLSILIRPSPERYLTSKTVADVVDEWERNNLNNSILTVLKIGFCLNLSCNKIKNHRKTYCVDETSGYFGIHKNYAFYRDLLKKIQSTYVQDIQPDYVKKQEAKAL